VRQLSVKVVGANHPNTDGGNRRSEIAFCDQGEKLELCPEPKNPHDEHAIAVYSARQFQIGYVSSERAVLVGTLMRDGHTLFAIFQDIAVWGAVARIGIDCAPVLPAKPAPKEDHDVEFAEPEVDRAFWPDFIPPEE
jgi:hypothetical protein